LARIPLFALALLAEWIPLLVTIASSVLIQNAKGLVIAPLVEGGDSMSIPWQRWWPFCLGLNSGALPVLRSRCRLSPSWTCCGTDQ
jgi:hypothetical protein